jgi:hypothetical protein
MFAMIIQSPELDLTHLPGGAEFFDSEAYASRRFFTISYRYVPEFLRGVR